MVNGFSIVGRLDRISPNSGGHEQAILIADDVLLFAEDSRVMKFEKNKDSRCTCIYVACVLDRGEGWGGGRVVARANTSILSCIDRKVCEMFRR